MVAAGSLARSNRKAALACSGAIQRYLYCRCGPLSPHRAHHPQRRLSGPDQLFVVLFRQQLLGRDPHHLGVLSVTKICNLLNIHENFMARIRVPPGTGLRHPGVCPLHSGSGHNHAGHEEVCLENIARYLRRRMQMSELPRRHSSRGKLLRRVALWDYSSGRVCVRLTLRLRCKGFRMGRRHPKNRQVTRGVVQVLRDHRVALSLELHRPHWPGLFLRPSSCHLAMLQHPQPLLLERGQMAAGRGPLHDQTHEVSLQEVGATGMR